MTHVSDTMSLMLMMIAKCPLGLSDSIFSTITIVTEAIVSTEIFSIYIILPDNWWGDMLIKIHSVYV